MAGFASSPQIAPANSWGPSANQDRHEGKLPKVPMTSVMTFWQNWGRNTLHTGGIVCRRGDARVLFGYFRFSQFVANADNSAFSHTGVVAIENGEPVVYDTSRSNGARTPSQPKEMRGDDRKLICPAILRTQNIHKISLAIPAQRGTMTIVLKLVRNGTLLRQST